MKIEILVYNEDKENFEFSTVIVDKVRFFVRI